MANITVLSDALFPDAVIAAGLRGTQLRQNTRTPSGNGRMRVNIDNDRTVRRYEVGIVPMLTSEWQQFEAWCEVTEYGAFGGLLLDPKDQSATAAEGLLQPYAGALVGAIGFGYGVPSYKLRKRYALNGTSRSKDRAITRPLATPSLLRAASPVTIGAAAGNASVNVDTGLVTFVADSSSAVTAVTVGATTQVTLSAALAGLAIGGRLYLAGLTGADAALLNGASHAISNITGGGSNVYHLSTGTAGKTITAAGTGYKYPQASEALAWSGPFYVPVSLEVDQVEWGMVRGGDYDGRLIAGPSVALMEVLE